MKESEIVHYRNLIKLIKACPYWAADRNFELVVQYVYHVIEGNPIDEYYTDYDTMFSIINEENKEQGPEES